ncbi:yos1-like domain-containing protein [Fusarium heterosporum]|uniref:Yos1-like domain-containing protein n=1 Tax=Fusarium heterosporum TaxID=42747 RepID=A0A8H5WYK9_FUSHE|nr:yos1-like domain-containing protein [Fusarium heterosporum]
MWFFGSFLYVCILLINAVAVLSEDRFLARSTKPLIEFKYWRIVFLTNKSLVNLSPASYDPAFGAGPDASVKAKIINLIASVRTIMRMPLIFVNSVIILYELILG